MTDNEETNSFSDLLSLESVLKINMPDARDPEIVKIIKKWQKKHPNKCSRCGTKMDRPMNTAHANREIHLCDNCAIQEAIVEMNPENKNMTLLYWNAKEWECFNE